jgi:DNA adenine methylase
MLAPWIVSHFPPHQRYIEPFAGGASVLIRKERSREEVYNDLSDEVVNLFKVLRSDDADKLIHAIRYTPYSRAEWEESHEPSSDPVEQARRTLLRSASTFHGLKPRELGTGGSGMRTKTSSRTTPAQDWKNLPREIEKIADRLRGVIIEKRDAFECIDFYDSSESLFYVDPPYLPETRSSSWREKGYSFEMTCEDHEKLLSTLLNVSGYVVLSHYDHPLYRDMLEGWQTVSHDSVTTGGQKKKEILWLSPCVTDAGAFEDRQLSLLG